MDKPQDDGRPDPYGDLSYIAHTVLGAGMMAIPFAALGVLTGHYGWAPLWFPVPMFVVGLPFGIIYWWRSR